MTSYTIFAIQVAAILILKAARLPLVQGWLTTVWQRAVSPPRKKKKKKKPRRAGRHFQAQLK
jgi:hypothetical protein